MGDNPDHLYRLDGVAHIVGVINEEELLGVLPLANCINKFTVKCSWMQDTFGEIPDGADEATIMSLGSAALSWLYRCICRMANRNVKLASPSQLLQSWIFWQFSGFRPAGYNTCRLPLASRWSGYNPITSEKGPRVAHWRLQIDLLQARDFTWMSYSSHDVVQVVHPEILEYRHTTLWRSVTALIYFAVIE
ncbi:hypothetical protein Ahy_A06g030862 [Arachis hypogaea]|uniref:Aminotransferase-like plant mobile domain-containing protein n=1 Tax=Arachis hypogaea TaxID=3818 RepID=A0A445CXT8_ARAHY|nr:hypothetical protein Ahy_A06g030862 [Arachis hypogaea]